MVPSLDRYGRSLQDLINMVAELRKRGIGFTSLHENLDTTTPGGRLVFHVFSALAEFIRELIVIGTNSGAQVSPQGEPSDAELFDLRGLRFVQRLAAGSFAQEMRLAPTQFVSGRHLLCAEKQLHHSVTGRRGQPGLASACISQVKTVDGDFNNSGEEKLRQEHGVTMTRPHGTADRLDPAQPVDSPPGCGEILGEGGTISRLCRPVLRQSDPGTVSLW